MAVTYRTGVFTYSADQFYWGFGGIYETAETLNFSGSMTVNAPAALAVAAVCFLDATVNVTGTIRSTATAGTVVTLPIPSQTDGDDVSGPIDELIAAGSVIGNAVVNFSGNISSFMEGGGAIGAFSAFANATVTAHGQVSSESGFAIRVQSGAAVAHSLTSGTIIAGGGECAIMVEGEKHSSVLNRAVVLTTGDHVDGILATGQIDPTFSGNRIEAAHDSTASVTNYGNLTTTGDGIRAVAQEDIIVRNFSTINAQDIAIHLTDFDGDNTVGSATVNHCGNASGGLGGIVIEGDFRTTRIDISGQIGARNGNAISTGSSDDTITLARRTTCLGDIRSGDGNDVIDIAFTATVAGLIDTGAGSDEIRLGRHGYRVEAGEGDDVIYAGAGVDQFYFDAIESGSDTIHGFRLGQDRLDFDGADISFHQEGSDLYLNWSDSQLCLTQVYASDFNIIIA